MIVYRVAVVYRVHVCPASAEPHAFDIVRRVLSRTSSGECLRPHHAPPGVTVSCARRYPSRRPCANCTVRIDVVEEHTVWA